jgi:hypothetical protein
VSRRARAEGAQREADATAAALETAARGAFGDSMPAAVVAYATARVLWDARVRDYNRRGAAFKAARAAYERAQEELAAAVDAYAAAESALWETAGLVEQAATAFREARGAGVLDGIPLVEERGDAWEEGGDDVPCDQG